MTDQELKTTQALAFMGFNELKEISQSELDLSFKILSNRMNPETCKNEKYKDGKDYLLLLEYYNYLNDIKRTNETIRNILDPENKTYQYQDEKPEAKVEDINPEEPRQSMSNETPLDLKKPQFDAANYYELEDKPRIWIIILSLLLPLYGLIMFFLSRRLTPKASKWYLTFAIIGEVINVLIYIFLYPKMLGLM